MASGLIAVQDGNLLLGFLMRDVFSAKRTKFLKLQALWLFAFVLGAVVVDSIALGALKMNCLAHILISFVRSSGNAGVTEDD